jgi:hypothetical protein
MKYGTARLIKNILTKGGAKKMSLACHKVKIHLAFISMPTKNV